MVKKNQVARNERERNRVHQVNHGFDVLRNRLQPKNHTKKWSKADTLREAVKYIQQLQMLLNADQQQPSGSTSQNAFNTYPIKDEFSVYLPQNYQMPMTTVPQNHPYPTSTSSPTSSMSSYSPPCYQTPNYYHHPQ